MFENINVLSVTFDKNMSVSFDKETVTFFEWNISLFKISRVRVYSL